MFNSRMANAIAASVPKIVAAVAETSARRMLIKAESTSGASLMSSAYQRVDQPPHTVTSCDALNE